MQGLNQLWCKETNMVRYLVQWKNGENFTNHGFFRTSEQAFESIQDWWELNFIEQLRKIGISMPR